MNQVRLKDKILLTIKRIGINGEGIGYYKREAIFVDRALPGEVVEVEIIELKEGYATGRLLKIKVLNSRSFPNGDASIDDTFRGDNRKRFFNFVDNVKPNKTGTGKFNGKKVSISKNYSKHHYKQILNLIQMIVNEGGEFILRASLSDIFVKYDIDHKDGSKYDSVLNFVVEANKNGANIEIIELDELLNILDISEYERDNLPIVPFEFNIEESCSKSNFERETKIQKIQSSVKRYHSPSGTKLGDLFSDFFDKLKDNSNND